MLARKPAHWLAFWEGRFPNMEGGPAAFVPSTLTDDHIREINAKVHVMNELIDEACGRVLQTVAAAGLARRHRRHLHHRPRRAAGRLRPPLQGPVPHRRADAAAFGLAAGPFRRRRARRWSPTRSARWTWRRRSAPSRAWTPRPWMQGRVLPLADGEPGRERALCEWDSQFPGYGMHLRSIYRDGWLCTVYEPSTAGQPNGLEEVWGDARAQALSGGLRAVGHRSRRRGHRHRRALQRRRRPAPVREPLGRPGAARPARRPGDRPLRQPAHRGAARSR